MESDKPSKADTEESSREVEMGPAPQKLSRCKVVETCHNTAEVVIIRPATKGKGPAETVEGDKVSPHSLADPWRANAT